MEIKECVFFGISLVYFSNFAIKMANFLLEQAIKVRILHLGIKKKRVYFVLPSIFSNFGIADITHVRKNTNKFGFSLT